HENVLLTAIALIGNIRSIKSAHRNGYTPLSARAS
ncbi:nicotinamide riboside transporter PnuC, partial [Salmonella enterica subsp. enterica serovar Infantis]